MSPLTKIKLKLRTPQYNTRPLPCPKALQTRLSSSCFIVIYHGNDMFVRLLTFEWFPIYKLNWIIFGKLFGEIGMRKKYSSDKEILSSLLNFIITDSITSTSVTALLHLLPMWLEPQTVLAPSWQDVFRSFSKMLHLLCSPNDSYNSFNTRSVILISNKIISYKILSRNWTSKALRQWSVMAKSSFCSTKIVYVPRNCKSPHSNCSYSLVVQLR